MSNEAGISKDKTRCLISRIADCHDHAAGNLGRAVAEAFGSHGANLVLLDLNGEALESAYPVIMRSP